MTKKKSHHTTPAKPLIKALDKTGSVKEVVAQSADELLLVNAVLRHRIPGNAQTGDVAQALAKTEDIEEKIDASAKDLTVVTELLAHEVDERIHLERELMTTKAALAREKAKP